jgi:hypothetical protein
MNLASVDKNKAPWIISTADQPPALEIVLRRQTVIISWNQFVYAEGGDDEVRIAFASHDVAVKGAGLDPLLRAIAANRVVLIRESDRAERFSDAVERFIREIAVRRIVSFR